MSKRNRVNVQSTEETRRTLQRMQNAGYLNEDRLDELEILAHERLHGISSTLDHTGIAAATENDIVKFDANGLPADSNVSINADGDILPETDNAQDLGSLSATLQDAFFTDANGEAFSARILANVLDITQDPSGFFEPENVIVTGDSTARTVTLTGTVEAYWHGKPIEALVSGWESPAHSATTTAAYFLWYDGTSFSWNDTSTLEQDFYKNTLISIAFYNATDGNWCYMRECHGVDPWASHREAHNTIGTYRFSGGTLGDYTALSTTVADRRPSVSTALVFDEDLPSTIPETVAEGAYSQYYLSGAGASANFITTTTDIVPLNVNRPYWNEFTGGVWQQTPMSNNNFMCVYLILTQMAADADSQKMRATFIQGQAEYETLAAARAETTSNITYGELADLNPETIIVAQVIIKYRASNWRIEEVNNITGSKVSQTASPQGNYLSSVSATAPITGTGVTGDPLVIAAATSLVDGYATATQITKLDGIEALAEANNISDANATTLTDGSNADLLHIHSGGGGSSRYKRWIDS